MLTAYPVSPVTDDTGQILLYVEQDLGSIVTELQSLVATTAFHFKTTPLCKGVPGTLMLVACRDRAHANSLTYEHTLASQQVYWLVDNRDDLTNHCPLPGHWFLDWRTPGALLAILSLLNHHTKLIQDNQRAAYKLALLSDWLGELSLILNADGKIIELNPKLSYLLGASAQPTLGQDGLASLQIPSSMAKKRMQLILADLKGTHSMTRLPPFPIQLDNSVIMTDGFAGQLPNDEAFLILRQVTSWQNQEWVAQLDARGAPVTLLLVNPEDFAKCNQKYGRELGDQVLDEIMGSMTKMLRADDFSSRYSGAVFAVHLPDTNERQGQVLAARMLKMLSNRSYSQKKINLQFSVGLATLELEEQLGEQSPLELFRRANSALQAARGTGGEMLVSWQPRLDATTLANLDHITGKLWDVPGDDFRLMTLQWDIIRLIGSTHSLKALSKEICPLLTTGLQSEFSGLYLRQGDNVTNLSCSTAREEIDVAKIHQWVQKNSKFSGDTSEIIPYNKIASYHSAIIPLVTRGECLGVLTVCWKSQEHSIAETSLRHLQEVIPNLAAAIDRIILLQPDKNQQLVAPQQSSTQALLFESAAMYTLMQQVQLVAPTDASVLVIGQSGTGKEGIALQIHKQSLHPDKPFITVDCTTIVGPLIESELFGHRKGAFTGASSDQPGLIAQADGGTLFLDEVGELPLDIQSKLLRFVQEKTYVAVGDQRVRKVDVRLILATNRNLVDEVAAGRFRADLFYRINVFTLNLPPLHQRDDDSLLLSRHYLQKFSQQYNKKIRGFSDAAISKLRAYKWPGNVRELRNCMMRAVITCSGEVIEATHLILQDVPEGNDRSKKDMNYGSPIAPMTAVTDDDLQQIAMVLNEVIIIASQQPIVLCVSVWLEKLWLELCLGKWGSLYQVAKQLNKSESTLRRRYAKYSKIGSNHPQIQELTVGCKGMLEQLLNSNESENLWSEIEKLLYIAVLQQDFSQQLKAKLLDVTQPTLRKIIQQL
ncbi:MAG: hydrogenase-4 transcriptional activator [Paraglaciecola sp.]|jgi:hydrogenase-4 transcriptional activator